MVKQLIKTGPLQWTAVVVYVVMCLLQFFDDVVKLEERVRQLTSSVDTIDEKQHVGLDISEQLIQQLQVRHFTSNGLELGLGADIAH